MFVDFSWIGLWGSEQKITGDISALDCLGRDARSRIISNIKKSDLKLLLSCKYLQHARNNQSGQVWINISEARQLGRREVVTAIACVLMIPTASCLSIHLSAGEHLHVSQEPSIDALAPLEFKLSVSQWVSKSVSDSPFFSSNFQEIPLLQAKQII